jgi:hypothetical protein
METTQEINTHSMLSIILFIVAGVTGFFGFSLNEIDLLLASCLKIVSICTGAMLGVIKFPEFWKTVKGWFK